MLWAETDLINNHSCNEMPLWSVCQTGIIYGQSCGLPLGQSFVQFANPSEAWYEGIKPTVQLELINQPTVQ